MCTESSLSNTATQARLEVWPLQQLLLNVVSNFLRQAEMVKQSERYGVVHRVVAVVLGS